MLKRRFNMRKNSAGEWRRQKAVVMHGVEPFVLVGEEETASCLCGLLHGMPKIMRSRSKE
jgi:hypothetical protein